MKLATEIEISELMPSIKRLSLTFVEDISGKTPFKKIMAFFDFFPGQKPFYSCQPKELLSLLLIYNFSTYQKN